MKFILKISITTLFTFSILVSLSQELSSLNKENKQSAFKAIPSKKDLITYPAANYKPDYYTVWYCNYDTLNWFFEDSTRLFYDINGNILAEDEYNVQGGTTPIMKHGHTYNLQNKETSCLNYVWNKVSGKFDSSSMRMTKYNTQQQVLEIIYKQLKLNGSFLENVSRKSFTYDSKGCPITTIYEDWDNALKSWEKHQKDSTICKNGVPYEIYTFLWDGFAQYDPSEKSTVNYKEWNDVNTYKLTSSVDQLWNNSNWENDIKQLITYDSYGNVIYDIDMEWNGTGWDTAIIEYMQMTYDKNHNINTLLFYEGGPSILDLEIDDIEWKVIYSSYKNYTYVNEATMQNNKIALSPNPINTSGIIRLPSSYKNGTLKLYDILGNEVRTFYIQESTGDLLFKRGDLLSGAYLLLFVDTNKQVMSSLKIMLE